MHQAFKGWYMLNPLKIGLYNFSFTTTSFLSPIQPDRIPGMVHSKSNDFFFKAFYPYSSISIILVWLFYIITLGSWSNSS